jgi:hypothetical protein
MTNHNLPNIFFISLFGEINNSNSRVYKIDKAFSARSTFVTPDFSHGEKKYKEKDNHEKNPLTTSVYLTVPSYSKNLSFRRIYSHLVFASKLKYYLNRLVEKPDIVICLMPTSSAAYVAGQYCKNNNIMFVIDIIDIWPDSLIPLSRNKRLIKLLLLPWKTLTKKAYILADYISGESKLYTSTAHKINTNVPYTYTYLGVDKKQTDTLIASSTLSLIKAKDVINLCYAGSLGNSYDFNNILNALKYIHFHGIKYKMYFIGEGEKRKDIEKFAKDNNLNVEITGRLSYQNYLKYLSICDIGFNSFKKGTMVVHSYKFNDYCACGLFVFNNLVGETSEMVFNYDIGVNYNDRDLSDKLLNTCHNWEHYNVKRNNIDLLIKNELDSQTIYKTLRDNILKVHKKFYA